MSSDISSYHGSDAPQFSRARLEWHVEEERKFELPVAQLRARIEAGLLAAFADTAMREEETDRWRGSFRRAMSLFDECEATITLDSPEGVPTSTVRVQFRFAPTDSRVIAALWVTLSGIGIPLAYGWRAHSERAWRKFSRNALDRFWDSMQTLNEKSPYR